VEKKRAAARGDQKRGVSGAYSDFTLQSVAESFGVRPQPATLEGSVAAIDRRRYDLDDLAGILGVFLAIVEAGEGSTTDPTSFA
jgi:hypothetical protein